MKVTIQCKVCGANITGNKGMSDLRLCVNNVLREHIRATHPDANSHIKEADETIKFAKQEIRDAKQTILDNYGYSIPGF